MSYNYFGKKILILGMGLTGISCINFFLKKGIKPKIIDESKHPSNFIKIPQNIEYSLGSLDHQWILESDLIVISPGISSFKPILIKARLLGIEIISDIELFSREVTCPIISITGTNGKSTVATMIEKIAKKSGYKAFLGGNIGVPVLEILDKEADLYIIELSSFQLENTFNLKSKIAVILNISEDHINRYPNGFQQYKNTKLSVYNQAEICIINSNDKIEKSLIHSKNKKWISFGTNRSDYRICSKSNDPILFFKNKKILNTSEILLYGYHNYNNILVSLAISDAMQFPRNDAINVLKSFSNLPHRFQIIKNEKGVRWINDSKSTNVNSTQVALNSIKTTGTIRLLLGGDSKSANFNILKNIFRTLKIKIYCFGRDGIKLSKICEKKSIYVENLKKAVILISKQVKSGDTVLLSPGCSSLDQFSNFEERGNLFIKLIKEIT
ncbi:UDP-N-acetylmuramoyl-L-alanine--D-glutamate ligase [Buchnera aphidicola str. APS (Acyrthosiphon pisum)]|uniref:UDP-N-acetylmuramoylalanine--D-glutamate ligase n=2 Tax=Buchnera aphidicola TaxID=9 RepID=MURD_BUCA5|nr:UDP-N-acetylmuramoyl-L-alanine--D-glutamate ligase [Buchnera aphidicola]B8D7C1.1 RecName: Full=UDP-N-acetylmuramoylalanine--D-glutamate ligase; AltName: Full=D-glutamic acid-adding enzyme; AltName: Full=UDP-N-acetylmuramoyl-L-alanyl-D-glutamate synthetase [Buchnera aphidicola str. Tuc7 (Acyrthosiphon pisum)]B8D916.1 RecName: Full=UDP-N-acetylmuramoylalanine--D-glutamate ligase; AltName: Full=D-glutamic acid-adding enzyme; AltName: Full=UDP-N-acetylmuramoyl-L-alanyl-D-glutamate synthetase [Buch